MASNWHIGLGERSRFEKEGYRWVLWAAWWVLDSNRTSWLWCPVKSGKYGVPIVAQQVKNPTSILEDAGSILGLVQWVKGSGVATSCGVSHRYSSGLELCGFGVGRQLQLWVNPYSGNLFMPWVPKKKKKRWEIHYSLTNLIVGVCNPMDWLGFGSLLFCLYENRVWPSAHDVRLLEPDWLDPCWTHFESCCYY